jgi:hypothetical protein
MLHGQRLDKGVQPYRMKFKGTRQWYCARFTQIKQTERRV